VQYLNRLLTPRGIVLSTTSENTNRLFVLRNRYGAAQSCEKLRLLKDLETSNRFWAKQPKTLHAKGGRHELDYAKQPGEHKRFLHALQNMGRRIENMNELHNW
jgi:hypothetical protein